MNLQAPTLQPVTDFARRAADELQLLARREPTKALAGAVCAGLVLNFLPKRLLVGTAAALLRPALLTFGLIKALEMFRTNKPI